MNAVEILIPIYRPYLLDSESISLRQCCKILKAYPICFVSPQSLDLSLYMAICREYNVLATVERFDDVFFSGISGYNKLLLSYQFYLRFKAYKYMLIYQLDAYVFYDRLQEWCQKDYDYIGAPLIGKFTETVYSDDMPMRVGNGGFSLRKVSTFLNFFSANNKVFPLCQLSKRISLRKKPYSRIFVWILMALGWRNKPKSVAKNWQYNEDDFWSGFLSESSYSLKMPPPMEAVFFSIERFPSSLYQNIQMLPFGCHAWKKYEYQEFWKRYIK